MNLQFAPDQAARLAARAATLHASAKELALFGESDPELAGECGVEVCALEARTLLMGGAPMRVASLAGQAARSGRPATLSADDVEALSRLEAVVALGSSRIGLRLSALDAQANQEGLAKFGGLLGVASSAYGFLKSVL